MNLFLRKILLAALVGFLVLTISSSIVMRFPNAAFAMGFTKEWMRVTKGVEASKKNIKSDTLYIGDSVGAQFFPYNNRNQLTLNGSVYPVGNYILSHNAIEHNPQLSTIIYLSVPQVLGFHFEREQTCNNFIKPFFSFENKKHLSITILEKIDKHLSSYLYLFPFFKVLPFSEINFEDKQKANSQLLSDVSKEYLIALNKLCSKEGIKFILASPPLAKSLKIKNKDWSEMKAQVRQTELESLFEQYFHSIQYYEDTLLRDHIHWQKSFVNKNRQDIVHRMLSSFSN